MNNKETIEIELPIEYYEFLKEIAKLADTNINTVINVILAERIIKDKRNEKAKKDPKENRPTK